MKSRFWILLEKKLTGTANPAELKELNELIASNDEYRYVAEAAYSTWVRQKVNEWIRAENKSSNYTISHHSKSIAMIRNYLKIAIRNLQKQKIFAFINVFGLSVGIACFSLLMLFTLNEFSFDKFHKNAANIYRIYADWAPPAEQGLSYTSYEIYGQPPVQTIGEAMKQDIPDVENYVRIQLPWGESLVRAGNNVLRAEVGFADPSLFSVFSFPLKYGSKSAALTEKQDIVLTSSRAKLLFGTDDALNKTVEIQLGVHKYVFRVSAVTQDAPLNSTIRFDILGSFSFINSFPEDYFDVGNNWHPIVRQTYVQLKPGSQLANQPVQLDKFLRTFTPLSQLKDMGVTDVKKLPVTLKLQPLLHIHTDSWFHGYAFTDYNVIDKRVIWILLAIAAGILLIACINFTTLAIGRSAGRSKEVGVRKVIGAERKQIIFQFLTEALLLSVISTVLGIVLANLVLPWFNQLTGRELHFSLWLYPQMLLLLAGVMFIVGLLAGSYPALVLSGFKPVEILKNKIRIGGSNLFTKSLVTFQFVLSIVLIISTVIILQQTKYMVNKNPGFDKENVVAVDASQIDPGKIFPLFKQELNGRVPIAGVTSAGAGLGAGQDFLGYSDHGLNAAVNLVDPDYIKVLGMHLLAGRDFDPAQTSDTVKRIIINETMMRAMGWNIQNAVGQQIKQFQGKAAHIIGVVKNFNFRPMGEVIGNQIFETTPDKGYIYFYVRVKAGNPHNALTTIQDAWAKTVPGVPMKYSFLDENINQYYNSEQRWISIVSMAGGISIFLASLGLLGLATLAAINRTKEIGIRKVLGASVGNVVVLLSKDFIRLIALAFIIATPLAWYVMHKWLQDYAARIGISWWVFVLTGAGTVLIAFISIGSQSIKAAISNPVKSLRTE